MKTLQELRKEPHYSYSAISTYLQCSLKYFFRYIEKIESELTSKNLVFGSAIHSTLNMIASKRMTNQPIPNEEIKDYYELEFENQRCCGKNIDFESPQEANELKSKGLEMIQAYLAQWTDKKIVGHDQAFSLEIPGMSKPVIGAYDLVIEEKGNTTIVDWKTAARKWADDKADKDGQATLYCHSYKEMTGKTARFRFDVITKTKIPQVQILPTSRNAAAINRLISVFQSVEKGIRAGVFYPNDTSFLCGGCEYADACGSWGKCKKAA